jgi:hypothetical protein
MWYTIKGTDLWPLSFQQPCAYQSQPPFIGQKDDHVSLQTSLDCQVKNDCEAEMIPADQETEDGDDENPLGLPCKKIHVLDAVS